VLLAQAEQIVDRMPHHVSGLLGLLVGGIDLAQHPAGHEARALADRFGVVGPVTVVAPAPRRAGIGALHQIPGQQHRSQRRHHDTAGPQPAARSGSSLPVPSLRRSFADSFIVVLLYFVRSVSGPTRHELRNRL